MSIRETMTPAERVDMLLQQARQFLENGLTGEAIARTRHALAAAEDELTRSRDAYSTRDLLTRRVLAMDLLRRLGARPLPPQQLETRAV